MSSEPLDAQVVLLWDPEPVRRAIAAECLRAAGFDVADLADPARALERARAAAPCACLSPRGAVAPSGAPELAAILAGIPADHYDAPGESAVRAELARVRSELAWVRNGRDANEARAGTGAWRLWLPSRRLELSPEALRLTGLGAEHRVLALDSWAVWLGPFDRVRFERWISAAALGNAAEPLDVRGPGASGAETTLRLRATATSSAGARAPIEGTLERAEQDRVQVRDVQHEIDALTGLPTRRRFLDRLGQALADERSGGRTIAVVCLSLRGLREVSGTLGLSERDALLGAIGQRLRNSVRDGDLVSRLGNGSPSASVARTEGDEFALAFALEESSHAKDVAQRLVDLVGRPYSVLGRQLALRFAAGIAVSPPDARDPAGLLQCAERAAWQAERTGATDVEFYSNELGAAVSERLVLEGALRTALDANQFEVHYQPRVDLRSGEVTGFEALVRWRDPVQGLVPPARFIGLAEETGLIVPLGQWVLRTACEQTQRWREQGLAVGRVAVNISPVQLRRNDLCETVTAVLQETGLPADGLELEFTESGLMLDKLQTVAMLRRLRESGVKLAIDDFGTGYSSLSYLRRFPVDSLKIDQSFVREIDVDPDDASIASSIILMGHSLKLRVVAEGVESARQLSFLRVMQCDEAQGYYFARPAPAEAVPELLREVRRRAAA